MIGVYFSGTGNTKHCLEYLLKLLDGNAMTYSIEDETATSAIQSNDAIVFAYPVYYSYLPKIVGDFIINHSTLWNGKKIFIIAAMGLFSGDGAGCGARLFKKYGAKVLGGLHIKMPDCIGDVKLLKKSLDENRKIVMKADEKIEIAAKQMLNGKYPKNGLRFVNRLAGLFGQRLYFRKKTKRYYSGIKADSAKCVACGLCAAVCPMKNIAVTDNAVYFNGKCTMCYRCFSNCPKQAITIIGKQVYEQSKFEKYESSVQKSTVANP
ncbi:MAG: 4Fe-4S binding protein [Clostridia bacterium]|jgi:ferredoxin/flavodoxin|nr:4Fe-4S binding protein [Clostridia bacterium]